MSYRDCRIQKLEVESKNLLQLFQANSLFIIIIIFIIIIK